MKSKQNFDVLCSEYALRVELPRQTPQTVPQTCLRKVPRDNKHPFLPDNLLHEASVLAVDFSGALVAERLILPA